MQQKCLRSINIRPVLKLEPKNRKPKYWANLRGSLERKWPIIFGKCFRLYWIRCFTLTLSWLLLILVQRWEAEQSSAKIFHKLHQFTKENSIEIKCSKLSWKWFWLKTVIQKCLPSTKLLQFTKAVDTQQQLSTKKQVISVQPNYKSRRYHKRSRQELMWKPNWKFKFCKLKE